MITALYNNVILEVDMSNDELNTLESIKQAGREEFLSKGFEGSSLRRIVKNAGVTTGAFYGYFSSKEALFNAIVEPHATAIMNIFMKAQIGFTELPQQEQPEHLGVESDASIKDIIDYIYQQYNDCKILLCCANGTSYANFVHNMVEIEVDATYRFIAVLKQLGKKVNEPDRDLAHIIVSGMFKGIFEVVEHDIPYEKAIVYAKQLHDFDTAGWKHLMGI